MPPSSLQRDVLVLGGGVAALCAAIAAREAGATVRLIEQAPRTLRGGNTRHSRNFRVAHAAPTPFSLDRYTEDEYLAELHQAAQGQFDGTLARLMVRRSAAITDWLAGHGVHLQPMSDGVLPPSRRTVFCLGGGTAMMNALYATAQRIGVEIRYASTAAAIRLENARVREVAIVDAAGRRTVCPRAVIACCGGYQANAAQLRLRWGEAADRFVVRGIPHARGEILLDLLDQGAAAVGEPGACHLVAVDARSPQADGGIVTRVLGIPAGIVVDGAGRRFHDEAADVGPTRYAVWGQLVAELPGQTAILVLDAPAERDIRPSIFPPIRAATIGGLAATIGLDPGALEATVAGFNAAISRPSCEPAAARTEGIAPAKTRWARPIAVPPFTAVPIRPGITFTCHGVKVDGQARVVLTDGRAVENMFAAGMIMSPNILDTGYLAGAAVTIGAVFGRIAGEEAARYVRG
jgi:tricarballylate dehydrogenase